MIWCDGSRRVWISIFFCNFKLSLDSIDYYRPDLSPTTWIHYYSVSVETSYSQNDLYSAVNRQPGFPRSTSVSRMSSANHSKSFILNHFWSYVKFLKKWKILIFKAFIKMFDHPWKLTSVIRNFLKVSQSEAFI